MHRHSIKIAGASGQGINSVGHMLALALKRSGYYVFAYREYPSLIKGGHATFQLDFSNQPIYSTQVGVDALIVLNRQATNWHLEEMNQGGIILHDFDHPRFNSQEAEIIKAKNINLVFVPSLRIAKSAGGNDIVTNIVSMGYLWKVLGLEYKEIEQIVREEFADKPQLLPIDIACVHGGYDYTGNEIPGFGSRPMQADEISVEDKTNIHTRDNSKLSTIFSLEQTQDKEKLVKAQLMTGNDAASLGALNGGLRMYFAYPMTPASSILDYLADIAQETGIVVKQAEDEITAASMALGAMHMGTRAMTGTSGGGYDLMTEHISMAASTEIPFVCVLAQRPGPATGLPTWTTQGDLMMACFSAHGEYTRCILSLANPTDAFDGIQQALNIAEKYQIPVTVLTDKLLAESHYTVTDIQPGKIQIDRGMLVTKAEDLAKIVPQDRYRITDNGISTRWLPGSQAVDFNANSDEHDFEGNVTEAADLSQAMISKRLKKEETLLNDLPEPEVFDNGITGPTIRFIGWGSTWGIMQDTLNHFKDQGVRVEYLHVKYLWPLKTEKIRTYLSQGDVTLIEGNATGQLGQLIQLKTGLEIKRKLLKWDGRPFFLDDIVDYISKNNLLTTGK